MKTKIILIAALTFTCLTGKAQEAMQYQLSSGKNLVWGIKGKLSAVLPSRIREHGETRMKFNSGFGASIGALANVYLGNYFYFEPDVSLFYEGYNYNNMVVAAPNSPSVNGGPNIYKLGVRLPLNFGYFINISDKWGLNVFTGPELGYTFYGTTKTDSEEVKNNEDLMNLYKGPYAQRRFEFGWDIGVGFPVNNFVISLEADLGITNMLKSGSMGFRENRLSLGITYYFVNTGNETEQ